MTELLGIMGTHGAEPDTPAPEAEIKKKNGLPVVAGEDD